MTQMRVYCRRATATDSRIHWDILRGSRVPPKKLPAVQIQRNAFEATDLLTTAEHNTASRNGEPAQFSNRGGQLGELSLESVTAQARLCFPNRDTA